MTAIREIHGFASGLILLALTVDVALAQAYPAKPIRIVVPFAPGGGTDILTRIYAVRLAEQVGQQVVIDNRPGASSTIGTDMVVKSPPDGYTVLMTDTSFAVNPSLYAKLPYDSARDLAPVILCARAPVILLVHPSVPARTLKEFIALAKSRPGTLAYASGGNGASTHLGGELLKLEAKIDMIHVPYKGMGPGVADTVGGQVSVTIAGISSTRGFVDAGKLRALAVTGERRNPALPNVPTFAENALPGVDIGTIWGAFVPTGTSKDVIARLNSEINRALQLADVKARVVDLGYEVAGGTPEVFSEIIRSETAKWARVIKTAGIRVD